MTHPVNYFEIGSPEPEQARAFYSGLFGWPFEEPTGDAPYWMVDEARGGLWDTATTGGESWAIFYVQVEDVRATLAQAEELGATIAVPFVDNGQIEFGHLIDPHGNRLGVWRPKG